MSIPPIASSHLFSSLDSHTQFGQEKWIQGDPADSTYQRCRESMNRYDYSRAAALD